MPVEVILAGFCRESRLPDTLPGNQPSGLITCRADTSKGYLNRPDRRFGWYRLLSVLIPDRSEQWLKITQRGKTACRRDTRKCYHNRPERCIARYCLYSVQIPDRLDRYLKTAQVVPCRVSARHRETRSEPTGALVWVIQVAFSTDSSDSRLPGMIPGNQLSVLAYVS